MAKGNDTKLYRQTDEGMEVIDGRKAWGVDIPAYAYDLWMPVIGLDTLALYGVLWRLARNSQTRIGLEKLAKSTRRGKKTLIKDMEILKTCGFIDYTTPNEAQRKEGIPTRFEIYDIPTTVSQALIQKYSPNEYKPLTWWLVESEGVGSNNPTVGSNDTGVGSNRTFNDPFFDPLFEKDSLSFAFESEIFLLAPEFILPYGSEVYRVYPKPKKPRMTDTQGRMFDMHQRMFWEDLAFYATICHLPVDEQKRQYEAYEAAQRKAAIDADVAKTTRSATANTNKSNLETEILKAWGWDTKPTPATTKRVRRVVNVLDKAGCLPEHIPLLHKHCVDTLTQFTVNAYETQWDVWRTNNGKVLKPLFTQQQIEPTKPTANADDFVVVDDDGSWIGKGMSAQAELEKRRAARAKGEVA